MEILKRIVRGLAALGFKFFILTLAIVSALVMTFNSPKKIEKSLSDSGVYSTFVSSALKEVQKSNDNNDNPKQIPGQPTQPTKKSDDIPIDNPAIVDAANQAFTPQLLQTTTENVLDGTYDWLSGKTATPSFTINFADAKQTFAQKVGEAAHKQLAKLPVCTNAQAIKQGSDINPFTATCRPKGLDIKAETKKFTDKLANSKEFLGTPVLTAKNLSKDDSGKTIFDKLSKAPQIYKLISASPWVLAALAIIAGLVTFALYDSKRRGLRNLAITMTGAGLFLILISFAAHKGFDILTKPTGPLSDSFKDSSFQQTIIKALGSISANIEQILLWFGIAYVVIGGGSLIALHFTKPKGKEGEKSDSKPADSKAEPKAESKSADKPAPKPKTIQG